MVPSEVYVIDSFLLPFAINHPFKFSFFVKKTLIKKHHSKRINPTNIMLKPINPPFFYDDVLEADPLADSTVDSDDEEEGEEKERRPPAKHFLELEESDDDLDDNDDSFMDLEGFCNAFIGPPTDTGALPPSPARPSHKRRDNFGKRDPYKLIHDKMKATK